MKRKLLVVCLSLIVCFSIFGQTNKHYQTEAESLMIGTEYINKTDKVLIVSTSDDTELNKSVEQSIGSYFEHEEIEFVLVSDHLSVTSLDSSFNDILSLFSENNCRQLMFVIFEDIKTYPEGGVSEIDSGVHIIRITEYDTSVQAQIFLTTKSLKDRMETYDATINKALSSMSEVIVSEYLKYCR